MLEFIAVIGFIGAIINFLNAERLRKRLNKIERMLAWKGVLKLDEMIDENLPHDVKVDLKEWNKI